MNHLLTGNPAARVGGVAMPRDPALPGLALLHHPTRWLEVLSRLLADWLGPDARLLDSRVAIRQLLPGKRCSAELELVIGPARAAPIERRRVLGKFYSDDQGARVSETLRELRGHGLNAGRFTVPPPLAYDPDHHLLLLEWADGEVLRSRLLASADVGQGLEEAAAWLLSLHRCGVASGRRYTHSRHVQTLALWKRQLTQVFPEGEHLLADVVAGIGERGRALSGWTPGPTHRDFTPEHLVVTGAQLVGLDFDEFCQYDRLFDVGHFTAHLRFLGLTHGGALNHFDGLADRFLAAYRAGGGESSEERVRLYEAIAYFKLGRWVALVQRSRDWTQLLPTLLREARRLL
jgi:aminoglycoside phosphotransferase (APT) family kinase protein